MQIAGLVIFPDKFQFGKNSRDQILASLFRDQTHFHGPVSTNGFLYREIKCIVSYKKGSTI